MSMDKICVVYGEEPHTTFSPLLFEDSLEHEVRRRPDNRPGTSDAGGVRDGEQYNLPYSGHGVFGKPASPERSPA